MKKWIKKWLGITTIELRADALRQQLLLVEKRLAIIERDEDIRAKSYSDMSRDFLNLKSAYNVAEREVQEVKSSFLVGMDLKKNRAKNWAIVCIDGATDFMRYVEFPKGSDQAKEMRKFLGKYSGSQIIINDMKKSDYKEFTDNLSKEAAESVLNEQNKILQESAEKTDGENVPM